MQLLSNGIGGLIVYFPPCQMPPVMMFVSPAEKIDLSNSGGDLKAIAPTEAAEYLAHLLQSNDGAPFFVYTAGVN